MQPLVVLRPAVIASVLFPELGHAAGRHIDFRPDAVGVRDGAGQVDLNPVIRIPEVANQRVGTAVAEGPVEQAVHNSGVHEAVGVVVRGRQVIPDPEFQSDADRASPPCVGTNVNVPSPLLS